MRATPRSSSAAFKTAVRLEHEGWRKPRVVLPFGARDGGSRKHVGETVFETRLEHVALRSPVAEYAQVDFEHWRMQSSSRHVIESFVCSVHFKDCIVNADIRWRQHCQRRPHHALIVFWHECCRNLGHHDHKCPVQKMSPKVKEAASQKNAK